jgi:hypothetical protein
MQGGLRGACGTLVTARRRSHIDEALAAIAATLPEGLRAQVRPDGKGGYFITWHNKLNYMRGPGRSYSDVILELAAAE